MNVAYDAGERYADLIDRAELYFRALVETRNHNHREGMEPSEIPVGVKRWLEDLTVTRTQELLENAAASRELQRWSEREEPDVPL